MNNENQSTNNFNLPQPVTPAAQPQQHIPTPPPELAKTAPPATSMPKAQDADIIEGEWVRAVEGLMQQMIDNPRQLSEEFTKLKVRYMRERYGKEMKAPGGQGQ